MGETLRLGHNTCMPAQSFSGNTTYSHAAAFFDVELDSLTSVHDIT